MKGRSRPGLGPSCCGTSAGPLLTGILGVEAQDPRLPPSPRSSPWHSPAGTPTRADAWATTASGMATPGRTSPPHDFPEGPAPVPRSTDAPSAGPRRWLVALVAALVTALVLALVRPLMAPQQTSPPDPVPEFTQPSGSGPTHSTPPHDGSTPNMTRTRRPTAPPTRWTCCSPRSDRPEPPSPLPRTTPTAPHLQRVRGRRYGRPRQPWRHGARRGRHRNKPRPSQHPACGRCR